MWVFFFEHTYRAAQCTQVFTSRGIQDSRWSRLTTNRTRQGPMSCQQEEKAEQDKTRENVFDLHKWVGLIYHRRNSQSRGRNCSNSWCFTSGLHLYPPILLNFRKVPHNQNNWWEQNAAPRVCSSGLHISGSPATKYCPSQLQSWQNLFFFSKIKKWNAK